MNGDSVVVDACVVLKWRLRDEEHTAQADVLLDACVTGSLAVQAPTLIDYEIANALKVAIDRGRISEVEAETALADFQKIDIRRVGFQRSQLLAFRLANRFGRSVYDAAYLALAQSHGIRLLTGDRRLFNAVHDKLSWVHWIGDFS